MLGAFSFLHVCLIKAENVDSGSLCNIKNLRPLSKNSLLDLVKFYATITNKLFQLM